MGNISKIIHTNDVTVYNLCNCMLIMYPWSMFTGLRTFGCLYGYNSGPQIVSDCIDLP